MPEEKIRDSEPRYGIVSCRGRSAAGRSWYEIDLSSSPLDVDNIVTSPNFTSVPAALARDPGENRWILKNYSLRPPAPCVKI